MNLEYLAQVVFRGADGLVYPDTLVGTDSHTPMVNGLGVLGWGVGRHRGRSRDARSAALDAVAARRRHRARRRAARPASTATDLVLTVAELLRKHGVVGKFVEFYGEGVGRVPLENRATIGNMSPEYGSTCTIFPVDDETLRYLRATGRPDDLVALVETYAKEQGLWHDPDARPVYDETISFDLSTVEPSLAGPARPQDRVSLPGRGRASSRRCSRSAAKRRVAPTAPIGATRAKADESSIESFPASDPPAPRRVRRPRSRARGCERSRCSLDRKRCPVTLADGRSFELADGHVVIAAITSCTNTSNPSVMIAAGLLARNAVARGLTVAAVGEDVARARFARRHRLLRTRAAAWSRCTQLGFDVVGYGCTTCIGNSGPLAPEISEAIDRRRPVGCVGALGQPQLRGSHPSRLPHELPRVAAARRRVRARGHDGRRPRRTIRSGHDPNGAPVYLRDLWPSEAEVAEVVESVLDRAMFEESYAHDPRRRRATGARSPAPDRRPLRVGSRRRPTSAGRRSSRASRADAPALHDIDGARVLALLGDSVTTDHISPAGAIRARQPGRASGCSSTASSRATSTPTARAAATTR